MAVIENSEFSSPHQTASHSAISDRIADLIKGGKIALRRYIVRTQTERALSKLSDRLLADIGITRSEIASFAAKAANGLKN